MGSSEHFILFMYSVQTVFDFWKNALFLVMAAADEGKFLATRKTPSYR